MTTQTRSIPRRLIYWLNRLLLKRLLSLNDRVLRDMGLRREDVEWACRLPLWQDAAREMRKVADARLRPRLSAPAE